MVDAVFGFLSALVTWLAVHLPVSPIRQVVFGWQGIGGYSLSDFLAWLNWFVPFGSMLALFEVWLGTALAFLAVRMALRPFTSVIKNVTPGS